MIETDWLTGEDPQAMLEHLRRTRRIHRTPAGKRKLRLFLCACFRQLWDFLPDPRTRAVIELAERLADGPFDSETLNVIEESANTAHWEAVAAILREGSQASRWKASIAHLADQVRLALEPDPWRGAGSTAVQIDHLTLSNPLLAALAGPAVRACLVREVFGNPFYPTVPDVIWLEWNDGTVWRMARTIYNDHCFDDLPILADALEDAGCTESDLLDHCRSGGIHVRGCWAVDLLLGRG